MNAVLQIIAKLYPNTFAGKSGALAAAGQAIIDKIKNDQDYVTRAEAEAFYTELLNAAQGKLTRGRGAQESSDECMDIIWAHLGLPNIDATLGTPYITLGLQSPRDDQEILMPQLFISDGNVRAIVPDFLNHIVPVKLTRNGNGKTKINTVAKQALQLTIKSAQITALPQDRHCRLAGFIVHAGSVTGGHYFSYINQGGQWRLYNDASISQVTPAAAEKAAEQAYLYFYRYTP
jgi:hypothetical protein